MLRVALIDPNYAGLLNGLGKTDSEIVELVASTAAANAGDPIEGRLRLLARVRRSTSRY